MPHRPSAARIQATRHITPRQSPAIGNPATHRRSHAITSRLSHALAAILVLVIEAAIAAFVHDAVVRPWLGDSLAVVLVYLVLRAATPLGVRWSAAAALAIACAIEVGQFFHLVDLLGLGHYRLARIMLGTSFDPWDFLAYAGGAVAVILVETALGHRRRG